MAGGLDLDRRRREGKEGNKKKEEKIVEAFFPITATKK
jgi:hypothetical protein